MKAEQIIASAYAGLGIIFGFLSNFVTGSIGNVYLAFILPIVFYIVTSPLLFKMAKGKKRNVMISNSLITFLCVWIVVWIILYNF